MEQIQETLDQAVSFHQKGEFERAFQGYNQVLEAAPEHYRAKDDARESDDTVWLSSGWRKRAGLKCIKENPNDYVAYNNIALGLFHLEKYDLALRQLDRALELKPNHPEALALTAK